MDNAAEGTRPYIGGLFETGAGAPPPYALVCRLGGIQKAAVFLAHNLKTKRPFCLRRIETAGIDENALDALIDESLTVGGMGHENLGEVLWARREGERQILIASEYIEGTTVRRLLRAQARLGWDRARLILLQLVDALRSAHSHRIFHRDLRPENVFVLEKSGSHPQVKLVDFGLGPTLGGPHFFSPYLAPEQLDGLLGDAKADIFAFGCIAYELLAGEPAWKAESSGELRAAHAMGAQIKMPHGEFAAQLPVAALNVLDRAWALDPKARFNSIEDLWLALAASMPTTRTPEVVTRTPTSIRWSLHNETNPVRPPSSVPAADDNSLASVAQRLREEAKSGEHPALPSSPVAFDPKRPRPTPRVRDRDVPTPTLVTHGRVPPAIVVDLSGFDGPKERRAPGADLPALIDGHPVTVPPQMMRTPRPVDVDHLVARSTHPTMLGFDTGRSQGAVGLMAPGRDRDLRSDPPERAPLIASAPTTPKPTGRAAEKHISPEPLRQIPTAKLHSFLDLANRKPTPSPSPASVPRMTPQGTLMGIEALPQTRPKDAAPQPTLPQSPPPASPTPQTGRFRTMMFDDLGLPRNTPSSSLALPETPIAPSVAPEPPRRTLMGLPVLNLLFGRTSPPATTPGPVPTSTPVRGAFGRRLSPSNGSRLKTGFRLDDAQNYIEQRQRQNRQRAVQLMVLVLFGGAIGVVVYFWNKTGQLPW